MPSWHERAQLCPAQLFSLPTPSSSSSSPNPHPPPSLVPLHSVIPQCATSIQTTCQTYMKVWMCDLQGQTSLHRLCLHPSLPGGGCSEERKAGGEESLLPSCLPIPGKSWGRGKAWGGRAWILPASCHQGPGATLHRDCPAGV